MPFSLDAGTFERRFRPEGLDTQASLLLMLDDKPAGICLIARQGWTSRVAAMAIASDFRGKGLGKKMMIQVIEEARERGDRRMVLEVIEQNPPAIGLYERVGFSKVQRLIGYRKVASGGTEQKLERIDPSGVIRRQVSEGEPNLPWDYKPETLSLKVNTVGWSLEDQAYALVSEAPGDRVVLWSLFTNRNSRGLGFATKLLDGLGHQYAGKTIVMPIASPEGLAKDFMLKNGFEIPEITQFEMAINL